MQVNYKNIYFTSEFTSDLDLKGVILVLDRRAKVSTPHLTSLVFICSLLVMDLY
jgi:hypothetical protein